jgi:hypothetical protein
VEPDGNNSGGCAFCDDPTTAVDVPTGKPVCEGCGRALGPATRRDSRIATDGGVPEHVDDDLVEAVAAISHGDVESITQCENGRGHFVIEGDGNAYDPERIDETLSSAGYDPAGSLLIPGMVRQNFAPSDGVRRNG